MPNVQPDIVAMVKYANAHGHRAIVDAAMGYCAALAANAGAAPTEWLPALARLDAALHDLQLACGYDPCGDDCPGFIAGGDVGAGTP